MHVSSLRENVYVLSLHPFCFLFIFCSAERQSHATISKFSGHKPTEAKEKNYLPVHVTFLFLCSFPIVDVGGRCGPNRDCSTSKSSDEIITCDTRHLLNSTENETKTRRLQFEIKSLPFSERHANARSAANARENEYRVECKTCLAALRTTASCNGDNHELRRVCLA